MKNFLFLSAFAVLLFSQSAPTFAEAFPDTKDHWGKTFIEEAVEKKIVNGYKDGSFKPNNNVSYPEALKIAFETFEKGGDFNDPKSLEPYDKVYFPNENEWYQKYLIYFDKNYAEGHFFREPSKEHWVAEEKRRYKEYLNITRAEAIYIILKIAGINYAEVDEETAKEYKEVDEANKKKNKAIMGSYDYKYYGYYEMIDGSIDKDYFLVRDKNQGFVSPFLDVETNTGFFPYIQYAYEKGIIDGYDKDAYGFKEFGVNDPVTRAEFVKMALNTLKKKESGDLLITREFTKEYTGEYLDETSEEVLAIKYAAMLKKRVIINDLYQYTIKDLPGYENERDEEWRIDKSYLDVCSNPQNGYKYYSFERTCTNVLSETDHIIEISKKLPKKLWEREVEDMEKDEEGKEARIAIFQQYFFEVSGLPVVKSVNFSSAFEANDSTNGRGIEKSITEEWREKGRLKSENGHIAKDMSFYILTGAFGYTMGDPNTEKDCEYYKGRTDGDPMMYENCLKRKEPDEMKLNFKSFRAPTQEETKEMERKIKFLKAQKIIK